MSTDVARFAHFHRAQAQYYAQAQQELRAGRKRTHWIWFVFPQLKALGRSANAQTFGLADVEDAAAYLGDPVLGQRLLQSIQVLLDLPVCDPTRVLGQIDALKLCSCLTLFAAAAPQHPLFEQAIAALFAGQRDALTLQLLR